MWYPARRNVLRAFLFWRLWTSGTSGARMQIVHDIDTDIGEDSPPERVVAWMLNRFAERLADRRLVMTTAFGMEGCALIDMIARHGMPVPVLYLDTGFLFPETLQLRDRLAQRYPHLSFE